MNIHLYQIWYDDNSKPAENSGFLAFDCRQNPEFLKREMAHLIRFYDEIVVNANDDDYFTLLSPRFFEKTGLTAQDIREFSSNNPNNDIYLFNPYPMNVYRDFNVWEQGESGHKQLKTLSQKLLNQTNINFNIFAPHRNTIDNTVYCNYWLGSKLFFDEFITFIKKLDNAIETMPNNEKEQYFKETTYFRTTAIFYPFIFERLINLYLLINKNIKTKPYIYQKESLMAKKIKPLEHKFYFSEYRRIYDDLERNENNMEKINQNFILLNSFLYPKKRYLYFNILNRWLNSFIKRKNIQNIDFLKILYQQ